MTAPWERFSNEEIETVCRYISDDKWLTSYFGVDLSRIKSVRANMRGKALDKRFLEIRTAGSHKGNSGIECHLVAADEAERGSRELNAAYQRMFRHWEQKNGFRYGAAEILLPAGYSE